MDLDQALQYGLRSGPKIWIKIRPYNMDLDKALQHDQDKALQYGLR